MNKGESFFPPADPNAPRCIKCHRQLRAGENIKSREDPSDPVQHDICPIEKGIEDAVSEA